MDNSRKLFLATLYGGAYPDEYFHIHIGAFKTREAAQERGEKLANEIRQFAKEFEEAGNEIINNSDRYKDYRPVEFIRDENGKPVSMRFLSPPSLTPAEMSSVKSAKETVLAKYAHVLSYCKTGFYTSHVPDCLEIEEVEFLEV